LFNNLQLSSVGMKMTEIDLRDNQTTFPEPSVFEYFEQSVGMKMTEIDAIYARIRRHFPSVFEYFEQHFVPPTSPQANLLCIASRLSSSLVMVQYFFWSPALDTMLVTMTTLRETGCTIDGQ